MPEALHTHSSVVRQSYSPAIHVNLRLITIVVPELGSYPTTYHINGQRANSPLMTIPRDGRSAGTHYLSNGLFWARYASWRKLFRSCDMGGGVWWSLTCKLKILSTER